MTTLKTYAPWALALLMAAAALWAWYHPKTINVPGTTEYREVEVPKPYKVISKVTITVTEIKVIEKEKVVEKEKWPVWFTGDANQQLTAIGLVEPYRGQTECASVINIQSGESQIITKQLPRSLLGFENTFRVGALFGMGAEVHASWTFARVGSFYATAGAAVIQNGSEQAYAVGIGVDKEF